MIDIDQLTYGDLKKIAAITGGVAKKEAKGVTPRKVIVRSYGAGVFFGTLVEQRGQMAVLLDCRRIWNWKGANTCSELALTGLMANGSKVAQPTPKHTIFEVVEIIDAQPAAIAAIEAAKWSA